MGQYLMPTKVITGKGCIVENSSLLKAFGNKALLVTGKSSAKNNGSQDDMIQALNNESIDYVIYDEVMSNPTVACAYEGAALAMTEKVDFVIAIGGGSAIDAAKAMALLALDHKPENQLFNNPSHTMALPIIAIPTTAGTGSEVTQYAMLTNDRLQTKSALATPVIFPKIAFMDPKYMMSLPLTITINTGIDALSHAVEGMLAVRANMMSDVLAKESIHKVMKALKVLEEVTRTGDESFITYEVREELLMASMLAGMVIAQTGTTAVHAMGYSLTYFRNIDHGRANGLLLGHFMVLVAKENPNLTDRIISAMGVGSIQDYIDLMDALLMDKEPMTEEEIKQYSSLAIKTPNIANCLMVPTEKELAGVFTAAFA